MPSTVNWLVLGLTLIVAVFLAWRKEWVQNGKGFVDVSPLQLAKLTRGVTGVAAAIHVKPYLHKWIKITGTIGEVDNLPFTPFSYVRLHWGQGDIDAISITMTPPRWKGNLFVPLPRGTVVTVAGRISEINPYDIKLKNSEFISTEIPPVSIPDQ